MTSARILSLAAFVPCALSSPAMASEAPITVAFEPSNEAIANPERGYYRAAPGDLSELGRAFLDETYAEGYRLVYARMALDPWRDAPLPPAHLTRLQRGFDAARRAGIKLIVRATYNYPRGETGYQSAQDAPLPIVLKHIEQLRPLLQANGDVIAFVQAGFVGAWGEWHASSNKLTEPAARTAIKDALLAAVPGDRSIQFRYPPYIMEWIAAGPAARIGFHNDCFLASTTDVGTYSDDAERRAVEQARMAQLGATGPFGGETCNPADDPNPVPRTRCADIFVEGARYRLTYLNTGYYRPLFHDAWTAQGCGAAVSMRMGYRLRFVVAAHPASASPGGRFALGLMLRNDGWANLYNPRRVELLLRLQGSKKVVRLTVPKIDPRQWQPGADATAMLDVALPADLARGRYDLLVAMPDASATLAGDARFAIRPANAAVRDKNQGWDASLGAFAIGSSVDVR